MEIPNPAAPCRRPDKIGYRTKRAAEKARKRFQGDPHKLSAYRCTCGLWHIGKSTAEERARNREFPA